ncbi:MAG: hypothetical protein Q9183_006272 [Haloplaca sp. 2 TL-2023]
MFALPTEPVENLLSQDLSSSTKKRKRSEKAPEELEVDIHAPEPPSKKALRKAKKAKEPVTTDPIPEPHPEVESLQNDGEADPAPQVTKKSEEKPATSKRSAYGIWIGNLLYTSSKNDLRAFFTTDTNITDTTITRIHMPTPTDASSQRQKLKPQNKGFAYVDFSTPEALTEALALSETLLAGRKVLIKDAKNFEGRPDKKDEAITTATKSRPSAKPPSKRIFVGNLGFDTDKEDLEEHFARCGEVSDVHVATFEDSGKCKGYGWVTFADVEAAEAAVRGWVIIKAENSAINGVDGEDASPEQEERADEGDELVRSKKNKKRPKDRKWWVNKLKGRPLRMEFAEDASVRYKKRFGKDATSNGAGVRNPLQDESTIQASVQTPAVDESVVATPKRPENRPAPPHHPTKSLDARNIKPGAAHAAAPRLTGGIIPSEGRKTTFV